MALSFMGTHADRFCSVKEIVAKLGVPRRLLAEVLKALSHAGLVRAIRGPGGGYRLVHKPEELTLAMVIRVLEGPIRVTECSGGGTCELEDVCVINEGIHQVVQGIEDVLAKFTLADLTPSEIEGTAIENLGTVSV